MEIPRSTPPTAMIIILSLLAASCHQERPTLSQSQSAETKQAAQADQLLYEMATTYLFVLPENAADEDHPITPELVSLGKELFHEKAISLDKTVNCNTCHLLDEYGVNDTPLSKGVNGQLGARNSPTVYNAALSLAQFWDGSAKTVEDQVDGPFMNPKEMAMPSTESIVERLRELPRYKNLFAEAYHQDSTITYAKVAKAIGAFERTLMTPGRLDRYLAGDKSVLSAQEKQGLKKMLDYGCIPCHSGSAMGGALFHKFGLFDNYQRFTNSKNHDSGKMAITKRPEDQDVFKVPSLRNITKTAPYFHDGSVEKLEDAVQIMANLQLGRQLSEQDVKDIMAFLEVSADWD